MGVPKAKEPSLLRQWLNIQHERALTRKALRLCAKQEWSVEFLTALLIKAANIMHRPLEMEIRSPNGVSITVRSVDAPESAAFRDDSIFNHLDNEAMVQAFLRQVNSK